jgi:hypothetical protein
MGGSILPPACHIFSCCAWACDSCPNPQLAFVYRWPQDFATRRSVQSTSCINFAGTDRAYLTCNNGDGQCHHGNCFCTQPHLPSVIGSVFLPCRHHFCIPLFIFAPTKLLCMGALPTAVDAHACAQTKALSILEFRGLGV